MGGLKQLDDIVANIPPSTSNNTKRHLKNWPRNDQVPALPFYIKYSSSIEIYVENLANSIKTTT